MNIFVISDTHGKLDKPTNGKSTEKATGGKLSGQSSKKKKSLSKRVSRKLRRMINYSDRF